MSVVFATGTMDVPPGMIIFSAAGIPKSENDALVIPVGYLYCNGDKYLSATYPALYDVLGDTYMTSDEIWSDKSITYENLPAKIKEFYDKDGNQIKFRVPDLREYFVRGYNDSWRTAEEKRYVGYTEDDNVGNFDFTGTTGETTDTGGISINESSQHTHSINFKTVKHVSVDSSGGVEALVVSNEPKSDDEASIISANGGKHNHNGTLTMNEHSHSFSVSRTDNETRPKNIWLLPLIKY